MIDLHLHLLPEVDDGAQSIDETRQMLSMLGQFGFDQVVSTPHLFEGLNQSYWQAIGEAFESVAPEAESFGVDVGLGFEVMLQPNVPERLRAGEPLTLAGSSTLLVELPFSIWPPFAETVLFELQTMGYQPLLAHPERYEAVHRDPEIVTSLAERGVATQVTFASLAGDMGRESKRTAETLLRAGVVTLLATDAHSIGRRLRAVPKGLERAEDIVGESAVVAMTETNPRALLDNEPWANPPLTDAGDADGGLMRRVTRKLGGS